MQIKKSQKVIQIFVVMLPIVNTIIQKIIAQQKKLPLGLLMHKAHPIQYAQPFHRNNTFNNETLETGGSTLPLHYFEHF